jgi:hypothetical protein
MKNRFDMSKFNTLYDTTFRSLVIGERETAAGHLAKSYRSLDKAYRCLKQLTTLIGYANEFDRAACLRKIEVVRCRLYEALDERLTALNRQN